MAAFWSNTFGDVLPQKPPTPQKSPGENPRPGTRRMRVHHSAPAKAKNVVGPQVRRLRNGLGLSQSELAVKLQLLGWDLDRGALAKIEARLVAVTDYEMLYLARVLGVALEALYATIEPTEADPRRAKR